jgi:hypothetical protein
MLSGGTQKTDDPEKEKSSPGYLKFLEVLTSYFQEFLETDFHKRKAPKRAIRLRDRNSNFVGFSARKYPEFEKKLWRTVQEVFQEHNTIRIRSGQFLGDVPKNTAALISSLIDQVSETDLEQVRRLISAAINESVLNHRLDVEIAIETARDKVHSIVKEVLVAGITAHIKGPLAQKLTALFQSLALLESHLTDSLTESLRAPIADTIISMIARKEAQSGAFLEAGFSLERVREQLRLFFNNFAVNDLYADLDLLRENRRILDKHELYLYFYDFEYSGLKYPIFFVPVDLQKEGDEFELRFQSRIYINSRALQFIAEQFNRATNRQGQLQHLHPRILYPAEDVINTRNRLQIVLQELIDHFQLPPIDFSSTEAQETKGVATSISNELHLCLFDKTDESLVNDYEDIAGLLKEGGGETSNMFLQVVQDFLEKNPTSVVNHVQTDWNSLPIEERLTYPSPVPLNAEQRQILKALKRDDCRFLVVQGPPGTGKSHTITAIVFDAIQNNQSVLVLSDKEEALDVVEDKITECLNKIRPTEDFQNPILRLGKSSRLAQILSAPALNRIRQFARAQSAADERIKMETLSIRRDMTSALSNTIAAYKEVRLSDVHALLRLEETNGSGFGVDIWEIAGADDGPEDILQLHDALTGIREIWTKDRLGSLFGLLFPSQSGGEQLRSFLLWADLVTEVMGTHEQELESLKLFTSISEEDLEVMKQGMASFSEMRRPVLGYLFQRGSLEELSRNLSAKLHVTHPLSIREDTSTLTDALMVLQSALASKQSYETTKDFKIESAFLETTFSFLREGKSPINAETLSSLRSYLETVTRFIEEYPKTSQSLQIHPVSIASLLENHFLNLRIEKVMELKELITLRQRLGSAFSEVPDFSYPDMAAKEREYSIHDMVSVLDRRVLAFEDEFGNDAQTLKKLIRQRRKFPKDKFPTLKSAFPCIVASIRDYAEFIPLVQNLFDVVVIDEASQVSIAQAFPALLRGKRVVVLGDHKQFCNVKSSLARTDINRDWQSQIRTAYENHLSAGSLTDIRVEKFDIKTSILDFFTHVANYKTMLLKHFRGYRELISYSNRYFYSNSLQAIRIRSHPIDDCLRFTILKSEEVKEGPENTNQSEIRFIISELKKLKEVGKKLSVGVITPHTNQQKLLSEEIQKLPEKDYFYDKLRLKVMTFDTCQGEERDVIFYSMVADGSSDRLWGVFPRDLQRLDVEDEGNLKAQRLNVGFSRAKETMHFVLSKPIEDFKGAIGEALRHYANELEAAQKLPTSRDVDQRSPQEPKVLEWLKSTRFFQDHQDKLELKAQFPIGEYLKQLDPSYEHPKYCVDFLLLYRSNSERLIQIIIEYDGFEEHFKSHPDVSSWNYGHYYSAEDLEREKILESYGYKFIRINRFNVGTDPVFTLNQRLTNVVEEKSYTGRLQLTAVINEVASGLQDGSVKQCGKCGVLKPAEDFKDRTLVSGAGRVCLPCKGRKKKELTKKRKESTTTAASLETSDESLTCPRCKSRMVLRKGKFGKFYGCTRYPRCKGTRRWVEKRLVA